MNKEEHPQSLSATTPRRVEGHELHMKVTGDEGVKGAMNRGKKGVLRV